MFIYYPLVLLVWTVTFHFVEMEPPIEKRLHHYLLEDKGYNKLIRPIGGSKNSTLDTKLTVRLGMRLSQLLEVSEKNQILTSNLWLRQEWHDLRLRWDPVEFGGIEMTYIPSSELWRPDIVLYNNADGDFVVMLLTKAKVHYDGLIVWEPPTIYKSYCPIDVEFFPFDQQECFLKFGIWTYDGFEVDLVHIWEESGVMEGDQMVIPDGVDLCDYYQNVEWDIINVTARRKEKFYPCCPEPFPDITFNITIRRRTLFYTINLIMPCVCISFLTILVFYLPSDSGEKITLSISIMLALTVFFLLLSDINPPTSLVIPLIGKYLLFTMIVVTMSIFLTVYTLSVHFRSPATHVLSPWVKRIFIEILPNVLFMKRPEIRKKRKRQLKTYKAADIIDTNTDTGTPESEHRLFEDTRENLRQRHSTTGTNLTSYPPEIRESINGVKFIAEHLRKEDEETSETQDWNYVAMVMDRLFLIIFTTACVCGTLGIFLNAPTLYDPRIAITSEVLDYCSKHLYN